MFLKALKIFLLSIFLFSLFGTPVFADIENADETLKDEKLIIHLFDDRLCPVCRDTKNFIESILDDYPEVELKIYPISDTQKLSEIAKEHGVEDYGIMAPTIFIGDNFFQFRDFTSRNERMIINAIEGKIIEK